MYENYSVLFVDDEVHILNSLRRGLIEEEYTRFFANSGKEALKIMENKEIHLIVTDMRMPEMTGLDLLKIVDEKWPNTVKVILSGYTQLPQILVTINQVDIFKFVTKPWTLEDLDAVIKKSLDYYILQEENRNYQKVLEKKNIAYQNILKRIDEVISETKKSSQLLGLCGKKIFGFEKNYSVKERIRFQSIFALEEEIFDMISQAVIDERKSYSSGEIVDKCIQILESVCPEAELDKSPIVHKGFEIKIELFKAAILITLLIFEEEMKKNGVKYKIKCENKFKLSIISPKIKEDSTKELTRLDVKLDFAKTIIDTVLSLDDMLFQIVIVEGNLMIGFSIEEKQNNIE